MVLHLGSTLGDTRRRAWSQGEEPIQGLPGQRRRVLGQGVREGDRQIVRPRRVLRPSRRAFMRRRRRRHLQRARLHLGRRAQGPGDARHRAPAQVTRKPGVHVLRARSRRRVRV